MKRWDLVMYRDQQKPIHLHCLTLWEVVAKTNEAIRLDMTTRIVLVPTVPCSDS